MPAAWIHRLSSPRDAACAAINTLTLRNEIIDVLVTGLLLAYVLGWVLFLTWVFLR